MIEGRPNVVVSEPLAVLIAGDPATGKSTLGALLARQLGAVVLDLDVLTGPLTEVVARLAGVDDLSDPVLAALTRDARYLTLLDVADATVRGGVSAILVAPFSAERRDPARWEEVRARLESAGARVALVWLRLAGDELVARLSARGAARDAVKIADPERYVAGLGSSPPVGPHLALDGAAPAAELVRLMLRYLNVDAESFAIDGKA